MVGRWSGKRSMAVGCQVTAGARRRLGRGRHDWREGRGRLEWREDVGGGFKLRKKKRCQAGFSSYGKERERESIRLRLGFN